MKHNSFYCQPENDKLNFFLLYPVQVKLDNEKYLSIAGIRTNYLLLRLQSPGRMQIHCDCGNSNPVFSALLLHQDDITVSCFDMPSWNTEQIQKSQQPIK